MPGKTTSPAQIYQLKVTLRDSSPPIWRRIQVPANIKLSKLHRILQVLFNWTDSHLHQFVVTDKDTRDSVFYTSKKAHEFVEDWQETKDEDKARLEEVLTQLRKRIVYELGLSLKEHRRPERVGNAALPVSNQ